MVRAMRRRPAPGAGAEVTPHAPPMADRDDGAVSTLPCGLGDIVADPAIATVLAWVAVNNHRATALLQEFLALWCVRRRARHRPMPFLDANILAAVAKFVASHENKQSKTFKAEDWEEMLGVKARVRASIDPADLPGKLFNTVTQYSGAQVIAALNNNIVAQFKRTVVNVLKLAAIATGGVADAKAANKLAHATATHLLASQQEYDSGKWMPAEAWLWDLVQPSRGWPRCRDVSRCRVLGCQARGVLCEDGAAGVLARHDRHEQHPQRQSVCAGVQACRDAAVSDVHVLHPGLLSCGFRGLARHSRVCMPRRAATCRPVCGLPQDQHDVHG